MAPPLDRAGGHPPFAGLRERGSARDHRRMQKLAKTSKKMRLPSDFLGAFCFVVLIVTVVYAVLTTG